MANTKHYVITSITLGLIAASAAGIIGLTNFITKDRIARNEKQKVRDGIVSIFGQNSEILSEFNIKDENYKLLVYGYQVKNDDSGLNRFAIKTSGSNTYGKITLLVGVFENSTHDYVFGKLSVITDEQTYASTLEDEYIADVNTSSDYNTVDVHCGATYGATLVKEMIDMTVSYANTVLGSE